jgi:pyruvate dehydrogenase E2 component (dihydrolipoamide acetyltransferase)
MSFDFVLPDLGEGITEGEIRKWIVSEGDRVEEHQTVLEIETDKAIVEVPSPKSGRVSKIHKEEGGMAKVGEVLMTIAGEDEKAGQPAESKIRPGSVSVVGVLPEEEEEGEVFAMPAVRSLARELGVTLETLKGSGPAGSITIKDVTEAAENSKKAEDQFGEVEKVTLKGLRRTIAINLLASLKATASVTGMDEADITELWALRERE